MSFADPQSLKIGATENSLPRIGTGRGTSEYANADGSVELIPKTTESKAGRKRHEIRANQTKVTADPFIPTNNVEVGASVYLVIDVPPAGFTNAQQKELVDGFLANLQASSGANITKLIAGES